MAAWSLKIQVRELRCLRRQQVTAKFNARLLIALTSKTIAVGILSLVDMTGATCTASSTQGANFACDKAYDGLPGISDWASSGQGVGAWIEITFPGGSAYNIGQISVENRRWGGNLYHRLTSWWLQLSDSLSWRGQQGRACHFQRGRDSDHGAVH